MGASPETACPACGAETWTPRAAFADVPGAAVEECPCGMMRSTGLPKCEDQYEDQYYAGGTGARFAGPAESLSRWFRRRRAGAVEALHPAKGRVLDVGCGNGALLDELRTRGWEAHGTQVSRSAAAYARDKLGLDVFTGELTDAPYTPVSFDAVMLWHVLEHLEHPTAYLSKCRELLKDDGVLVVEVPHAGSVATALGGAWGMNWDPPNHLWHFTPGTLIKAIERAGFGGRVLTQWSWEFSLVALSQSMLNRVAGSRNTLLKQLGASTDRNCALLAGHAALGALAMLSAIPLSLYGVAAGKGEVIRVAGRKNQ